MNNSVNPFDDENQYYTYVDEYGNEYEYDEFWGKIKKGVKKGFKHITKPKNIIKHITRPVRWLNPVNIVKDTTGLINAVNAKPKKKTVQVKYISRPRPPIRTIRRHPVSAALTKPIIAQPKMTLAPKQSPTTMQNIQPKQAGLLGGNNKMVGLVAVLVIGGLIFYKMKPKGAVAK